MALSDKTDAEILGVFIGLVNAELEAAKQLAAETHSSHASGGVDALRHLRIHVEQLQFAAAEPI